MIDVTKLDFSQSANTSTHFNSNYKLLKPYFLYFFKFNEELFNDFFMKILDKKDSIQEDKNLFNWLYTIAKNMKKDDYYDSQKQIKPVRINYIISEEMTKEVDENTYQDYVNLNNEKEQEKIVELMFDKLSQKDRDFIEFYQSKTEVKDHLETVKYWKIKNKLIKYKK